MSTYKFFDTDISGNEEFDISGKHYQMLLATCFKYCASVAVIISPDFEDDIGQWESFRIPLTEGVKIAYGHYGSISQQNSSHIGNYEIRHYRLTDCLQKMISSRTDSLFKWICGWGYNNPNDLSFFRLDGSAFFSSIVHEGECTLYPTEDEDVSGIIKQGHWFMS